MADSIIEGDGIELVSAGEGDALIEGDGFELVSGMVVGASIESDGFELVMANIPTYEDPCTALEAFGIIKTYTP